MNLNPLDHSELAEFEAELLGKRPRLNAQAQQSIIYQAAFQADETRYYAALLLLAVRRPIFPF